MYKIFTVDRKVIDCSGSSAELAILQWVDHKSNIKLQFASTLCPTYQMMCRKISTGVQEGE